ncbi:TetR/AcrR family transcriptional regulator, transcriptional repressor for nem operon [Nonomuraea maritima]|uniref:TetR/AcrR family transcriptional regulator, transcriptional repressor for nem operon n=1 Tax=Nonomuraea maritima TaxID=683260 RepID=A0A1G9JP12_9ACTN|nr:TetR/AcrR family transcriptional regulator [Nonomuraea maritima]SDL39052.1 TetR/AcrR family transcriptional regulator, transcriptional repressor for nem operon [Nonomuraea maritima]
MGRAKQFDPKVAVERAMQVFWRKGYGGTTPQDLVDALGIGKGSLYNAFGSKHRLFEAALECYRDKETATLVAMLEEPGPVKERLRRALTRLAETDLADPDHRGCLAVNTAAEFGRSDESAVRLVRRMFDRTEDAFRAAIEEGQRAGEIRPDRDPRAIGSLLLNTVVGLRVLARVADGPERLSLVIDGVIDTL